MRRTITTIAAIAALSACAMTEIRKDGATPEQVKRDHLECEYEAEKATAAIINPFDKGWSHVSIRDRCLEVRGYRRVQVK